MSKATKNKSQSKEKSICDDELIQKFIKENDTCSHDTCDKFIKVIRLNCQFCNKFFCTSHVLPEIHGCGQAARKSASASLTKKPVKEADKKLLEKKMANKLDKMINQRKKKSK